MYRAFGRSPARFSVAGPNFATGTRPRALGQGHTRTLRVLGTSDWPVSTCSEKELPHWLVSLLHDDRDFRESWGPQEGCGGLAGELRGAANSVLSPGCCGAGPCRCQVLAVCPAVEGEAAEGPSPSGSDRRDPTSHVCLGCSSWEEEVFDPETIRGTRTTVEPRIIDPGARGLSSGAGRMGPCRAGGGFCSLGPSPPLHGGAWVPSTGLLFSLKHPGLDRN